MAGAGEVVTAAPYTATAITESTQILGDGNRIVNKTSSFVARDSQGRTRRETSFSRIGPLQVDSPKLVFINDPTTHTQYISDARRRSDQGRAEWRHAGARRRRSLICAARASAA